MRNYLISYDLLSPNKDYPAIIGVIKTAPYWFQLNRSVWYIKSPLSAIDIVQKLEEYADSNDIILVTEMKDLAWSNSLSQEAKDYIKQVWHL